MLRPGDNARFVNSVLNGKGQMSPWRGALTEEEIEAIFAPKLYHWFLQGSMRKLYRRLRIVEDASQTELGAPVHRQAN